MTELSWQGKPLEEEVANARLLAASPDLLAACEALVTAWSASYDINDEIQGIRDAIAKARGLAATSTSE